MGKLYDAAVKIEAMIKQKGLDPALTKGRIALQTGFLLSLITPSTPDDPVKLARLKQATRDHLNSDF